jgi:hypothetical protein
VFLHAGRLAREMYSPQPGAVAQVLHELGEL